MHKTGAWPTAARHRAAFLTGAGVGTLLWTLWWPHRDRGLEGLGLLAASIGVVSLAAQTKASPRAWSAPLVTVAVAAIGIYAFGVGATAERCGHCPPWKLENDYSNRSPVPFREGGLPADPDVRVQVEDLTTGEIVPAADTAESMAAHRLLFGPNNEVAWMTGNEKGTAAYAARVDWSTGKFTETTRLLSGEADRGWGQHGFLSGGPGPDAIAFEPDGTLRLWAVVGANTEADEDWVIETRTFVLPD